MARMDGKVALVTGAASGIGRSTAMLFALEGAKVVVADWMEDGGEDTVQRITDAGGSAVFVKVDVSDASQVEAMVGKAVETYGGLDYACNNAGIEGLMGATAECTEANWDRTIGINLTGVWLCMKNEIPEMLKRGGGAIVNMASVAGLVGFAGLPAYCASKGGIVLLTKAAALEYAKQGIRVNAVCPGVIRTAMVDRIIHGDPAQEAAFTALEPVGRMGTPDEIAQAVIWLCSDAASFVTGDAMPVDGGFVAQ